MEASCSEDTCMKKNFEKYTLLVLSVERELLNNYCVISFFFKSLKTSLSARRY